MNVTRQLHRFGLLLALATSGGSAFAQSSDRWQSLINDGNVEIELDTTRPVGKGAIKRAWLRWSTTKPSDSPFGKYSSVVTLTFVNCATRQKVDAYASYYKDSYGNGGNIGTAGSTPTTVPPASSFAETVPESMGEVLVDRLCKL